MARVKGAMMTRKHRNKILGLAKGYWGNKSRHFKMANEQMMKNRFFPNILLANVADGSKRQSTGFHLSVRNARRK